MSFGASQIGGRGRGFSLRLKDEKDTLQKRKNLESIVSELDKCLGANSSDKVSVYKSALCHAVFSANPAIQQKLNDSDTSRTQDQRGSVTIRESQESRATTQVYHRQTMAATTGLQPNDSGVMDQKNVSRAANSANVAVSTRSSDGDVVSTTTWGEIEPKVKSALKKLAEHRNEISFVYNRAMTRGLTYATTHILQRYLACLPKDQGGKSAEEFIAMCKKGNDTHFKNLLAGALNCQVEILNSLSIDYNYVKEFAEMQAEQLRASVNSNKNRGTITGGLFSTNTYANQSFSVYAVSEGSQMIGLSNLGQLDGRLTVKKSGPHLKGELHGYGSIDVAIAQNESQNVTVLRKPVQASSADAGKVYFAFENKELKFYKCYKNLDGINHYKEVKHSQNEAEWYKKLVPQAKNSMVSKLDCSASDFSKVVVHIKSIKGEFVQGRLKSGIKEYSDGTKEYVGVPVPGYSTKKIDGRYDRNGNLLNGVRILSDGTILSGDFVVDSNNLYSSEFVGGPNGELCSKTRYATTNTRLKVVKLNSATDKNDLVLHHGNIVLGGDGEIVFIYDEKNPRLRLLVPKKGIDNESEEKRKERADKLAQQMEIIRSKPDVYAVNIEENFELPTDFSVTGKFEISADGNYRLNGFGEDSRILQNAATTVMLRGYDYTWCKGPQNFDVRIGFFDKGKQVSGFHKIKADKVISTSRIEQHGKLQPITAMISTDAVSASEAEDDISDDVDKDNPGKEVPVRERLNVAKKIQEQHKKDAEAQMQNGMPSLNDNDKLASDSGDYVSKEQKKRINEWLSGIDTDLVVPFEAGEKYLIREKELINHPEVGKKTTVNVKTRLSNANYREVMSDSSKLKGLVSEVEVILDGYVEKIYNCVWLDIDGAIGVPFGAGTVQHDLVTKEGTFDQQGKMQGKGSKSYPIKFGYREENGLYKDDEFDGTVERKAYDKKGGTLKFTEEVIFDNGKPQTGTRRFENGATFELNYVNYSITKTMITQQDKGKLAGVTGDVDPSSARRGKIISKTNKQLTIKYEANPDGITQFTYTTISNGFRDGRLIMQNGNEFEGIFTAEDPPVLKDGDGSMIIVKTESKEEFKGKFKEREFISGIATVKNNNDKIILQRIGSFLPLARERENLVGAAIGEIALSENGFEVKHEDTVVTVNGGKFKKGDLKGNGFVCTIAKGKNVLIEGNFEDGKPKTNSKFLITECDVYATDDGSKIDNLVYLFATELERLVGELKLGLDSLLTEVDLPSPQNESTEVTISRKYGCCELQDNGKLVMVDGDSAQQTIYPDGRRDVRLRQGKVRIEGSGKTVRFEGTSLVSSSRVVDNYNYFHEEWSKGTFHVKDSDPYVGDLSLHGQGKRKIVDLEPAARENNRKVRVLECSEQNCEFSNDRMLRTVGKDGIVEGRELQVSDFDFDKSNECRQVLLLSEEFSKMTNSRRSVFVEDHVTNIREKILIKDKNQNFILCVKVLDGYKFYTPDKDNPRYPELIIALNLSSYSENPLVKNLFVPFDNMVLCKLFIEYGENFKELQKPVQVSSFTGAFSDDGSEIALNGEGSAQIINYGENGKESRNVQLKGCFKNGLIHNTGPISRQDYNMQRVVFDRGSKSKIIENIERTSESGYCLFGTREHFTVDDDNANSKFTTIGVHDSKGRLISGMQIDTTAKQSAYNQFADKNRKKTYAIIEGTFNRDGLPHGLCIVKQDIYGEEEDKVVFFMAGTEYQYIREKTKNNIRSQLKNNEVNHPRNVEGNTLADLEGSDNGARKKSAIQRVIQICEIKLRQYSMENVGGAILNAIDKFSEKPNLNEVLNRMHTRGFFRNMSPDEIYVHIPDFFVNQLSQIFSIDEIAEIYRLCLGEKDPGEPMENNISGSANGLYNKLKKFVGESANATGSRTPSVTGSVWGGSENGNSSSRASAVSFSQFNLGGIFSTSSVVGGGSISGASGGGTAALGFSSRKSEGGLNFERARIRVKPIFKDPAPSAAANPLLGVPSGFQGNSISGRTPVGSKIALTEAAVLRTKNLSKTEQPDKASSNDVKLMEKLKSIKDNEDDLKIFMSRYSGWITDQKFPERQRIYNKIVADIVDSKMF